MCCVYAPYVLHNNLQNPFDAIDTSATMLDQIALVLNQHTLVLDYLTAAQGGMCQIVDPACCHYVDNSSTVQIRADVHEARQMIEKFRWLNPGNWFKGVGGWFGGILHALMNGLLIVGGIILILLVVTKLIGCAMSQINRNRFKL